LRVLERSCFERLGGSRSVSVDIRIISATNKPVVQLVREGKLRTDLYYRINVVRLELPPLRERREDIPLLAQHFIQQYNQRYRKHIKGVADSVMRAWMDYRWPGNVRELQNVVNQGVLLSAPGQNELMAVPYPGASPQIVQDNIFDPNRHDSLESCVRQTVQELEKASIEKILGTCSYNQSKTAEILHITRKTLAKKMRDYGIRKT
jgi:DNA-binding NtrC family response regulator